MNNGSATFISSGNLGANPASKFAGKKTVIIAKRGCGKSFLISALIDVLNLGSSYDHLLIVSPTEKFNHTYAKYENSAVIKYDIVDVDLMAVANSFKKPLIVLDDCIASKSDKSFYQILIQLLSLSHVTVIMTHQCPLGIEQNIRRLIDYYMLGKEDYLSFIRRMFDHYNTGFPNFKVFQQAMQHMPNYHFMLIDQKYKPPKPIPLPEFAELAQQNTRNIESIVNKTYSFMVLTTDNDTNKKVVTDIVANLEDKSNIDDIFLINETGISDYDNIKAAYNVKTEKDIIQHILDSASYAIEKKKPKHFVIIMQNCSSHLLEQKSFIFHEMLFNGRHYQLTLIITEMDPVKFTPDIRSCFDMILTTNCWSVSTGKKVYDHYGGMFPDYNVFRKVLACIDDHQLFTFVNRRSPDANPWAFVNLSNNKIKKYYESKDYSTNNKENANVPSELQKRLEQEHKMSDRTIRLHKIKKLKNSLIGECYLYNADYPDDVNENINSIIKYSKDLDNLLQKIDENN